MSSAPFDPGDEVTNDGEIYQVAFDVSQVKPILVVVKTMAHIQDTEPTELPPLYDFVNGHTLDQLCTTHVTSNYEGDLLVEFTYLDHQVQVKNSGVIEIHPPESDSER